MSKNQRPKTKDQRPKTKNLLLGYFDSFPECHMAFDLLRLGFYFRVVPCGIRVCLAVDDDVVITRGALPSADGVSFTRLEEFGVDRIFRKVVITLDDDRVVAVCQRFIIPDCFHNVCCCISPLLRAGFCILSACPYFVRASVFCRHTLTSC